MDRIEAKANLEAQLTQARRLLSKAFDETTSTRIRAFISDLESQLSKLNN